MFRVLPLIFSIVLLYSCKVKQVCNFEGENISIERASFKAEDSLTALNKMIAPYKVEMESKMNNIIGYSTQTLTSFHPESPLGNFVADVVFEAGFEYAQNKESLSCEKWNTISLINFGGLRAPINEGDISIRNIYELMPFDNEIVIVSLGPSEVVNMLNYLFVKEGQPLSNGKARLSSDKQTLFIGGRTYNMEKHIYVITSDYLAKGGDKMSFFKSAEMIQTGILMRDALLDYVAKKKELPIFKVEDRIHFVR